MTANNQFSPGFDEAKIKNIIEHYENRADDEEVDSVDSDDTTVEDIKASLKQALQEVETGKTIPLEQMWDGIDV